MRSVSGDFLFSLIHFLVRVDAVGGDFDFGNAAEGEQKFYEVLGRLLRSLFHDVADSVGDRGLEHHTLGLQAGKVHTHELAGLQHDSKIVALRAAKCKPSPTLFPGWNRETCLDGCEKEEPKEPKTSPLKSKGCGGDVHQSICQRCTSQGSSSPRAKLPLSVHWQ
jgi:hypothetical protein